MAMREVHLNCRSAEQTLAWGIAVTRCGLHSSMHLT